MQENRARSFSDLLERLFADTWQPGLGRFRSQFYLRAVNIHLVIEMRGMAEKFFMDEIGQVDSVLGRSRQNILGASHGVQATVEMGDKVLQSFGVFRGAVGERTHHGQDVLDPVLKFGEQQILAVLRYLAGMDVDA